jgi:hypothetical protein
VILLRIAGLSSCFAATKFEHTAFDFRGKKMPFPAGLSTGRFFGEMVSFSNACLKKKAGEKLSPAF